MRYSFATLRRCRPPVESNFKVVINDMTSLMFFVGWDSLELKEKFLSFMSSYVVKYYISAILDFSPLLFSVHDCACGDLVDDLCARLEKMHVIPNMSGVAA